MNTNAACSKLSATNVACHEGGWHDDVSNDNLVSEMNGDCDLQRWNVWADYCIMTQAKYLV